MTLSISVNRSVRKWRQYPSYRDSGAEWFGYIPSHWKLKPTKHACSMNAESLTENISPNYEIEYVDIGNVTSLGEILSTQRFPFENAPSRARKIVRHGDTIISTVRTYLRAIAYISDPVENMIVSTGFAVLRPNGVLQPRFLWRAVQAHEYVEKVVTRSVGIGYPAISPSTLATLPLWVPPIDEQHHIVAFLDRETAKIDALIAKKERLIELLQEKRTALISHAVTKGLDPNEPMKDSGVEWLGKIPAHWNISSLGRYVCGIEQGWSPVADDRTAEDGEWGVIKLGAVSKGKFRSSEHKALPTGLIAEARYEVREGDFLLTRANTPDLVGDVCVVHSPRPRLMLCDLVYRIRLNERQVNKDFLAHWLLSLAGRYQITREARGSSQSMVKLSQGHIRSFVFLLPSLPEQEAIVAVLDRETARLDALRAKVREGIDKLREYRTALISAAVTGKIDVREEVLT